MPRPTTGWDLKKRSSCVLPGLSNVVTSIGSHLVRVARTARELAEELGQAEPYCQDYIALADA